MSKEDIINYVMTTPGNPNRAVLTGMLDGVDGLKIHICTSEEYDATSKTPTIEKPNTSLIYLVPTSEEFGDLFDEFIWTGETWERFGAGSVKIQNPDWNENDPTSAAYIENRPFYPYEEMETLYSGKLTFTNQGVDCYYSNNANLIKSIPIDDNWQNTILKLEIDGITFQSQINGDSSGPSGWIGAANPGDSTNIKQNKIGVYFTRQGSNSELNFMPFAMISADERPNGGTFDVKISMLKTVIKRIDIKYLPEGFTPLKNIVDGPTNGSILSTIAAKNDGTYTLGSGAVAVGNNTKASGLYSHAEGDRTTASGESSHAEGNNTTASKPYAHAEGANTKATEYRAHAEGLNTTASSTDSHAEGNNTTASGSASHAEGYKTQATKSYAHAEGNQTTASGFYSHAEGNGTTAYEESSHAEGKSTAASGTASHSEGSETIAKGACSHAEGETTRAFGLHSHAEGYYTNAFGHESHVEGQYTTAKHRCQHVFGRSNIEDPSTESEAAYGTYIEIVGNGTISVPSNARTLDWSGNESLAGSLTLGKGTEDEVTVTAAQLKALIALLNA